MQYASRLGRAVVVTWLVGCGTSEPPDPDIRARIDAAPLGPTPYPSDNPFVAERVALGRLLFFDPIMSGEKGVACGTCHLPEFNFTDSRQFPIGVGGEGLGPNRSPGISATSGDSIPVTPRNAPTVINAVLATIESQHTATPPLFWDGRASGLEDQALQPIANRIEMRGDAFPGTEVEAAAAAVDSVVARLRGISEYVQLFATAFPSEDDGTPGIVSSSTLARAIAAYERELTTRSSPFDAWLAGDDTALSEQQLLGVDLFFGKGKCFLCHRGPMLSSYLFAVTGVPPAGPGKDVLPNDDTGREEHTGNLADRYRFRVPSVRNSAVTAPYMHNGFFTTLTEVVQFYNDGAQPRHPAATDDMLERAVPIPIGMTDEEVAAIVSFLESLTDTGSDIDPTLLTVPARVPSGLNPLTGVSPTD